MTQQTGLTPGEAIASSTSGDDDLTGERVAAYLRRHPDFLARQPDLLKHMAPPARWSDDVVVDLQQYMVELLRSELEGLRDCTHEVIETSRSNMACQTRTHAAVLALVAAGDLDHMVRIVSDDLPILLDVDVAVLGFESAALNGTPAEIHRLAVGDVDRLIGRGQEVALVGNVADDETVFASAAGLVRSAALARLRPGSAALPGLLALGSRRDGAFHPGQGTELLRFLARIAEECLNRLLPKAA